MNLHLTLLGGTAVIAAAVCLMFWQILSAPDRPNYPTSGPIKRSLMFTYMVMLYGRGVEILTYALDAEPVFLTDWQVAACLAQAGLFAVFLVDHLRNWLPARTHRNINRLLVIARCGSPVGLKAARTSAMKASTGDPCPSADVVGPALVTLSLQGARVARPNESADAFIQQ